MQIYYCNDWSGEATTDSKKRKEKKRKGKKGFSSVCLSNCFQLYMNKKLT